MLLSIASRMFNDQRINKEQRGIFKELILINDITLLQHLYTYEANGDVEMLFSNIIRLIDEKSS